MRNLQCQFVASFSAILYTLVTSQIFCRHDSDTLRTGHIHFTEWTQIFHVEQRSNSKSPVQNINGINQTSVRYLCDMYHIDDW